MAVAVNYQTSLPRLRTSRITAEIPNQPRRRHLVNFSFLKRLSGTLTPFKTPHLSYDLNGCILLKGIRTRNHFLDKSFIHSKKILWTPTDIAGIEGKSVANFERARGIVNAGEHSVHHLRGIKTLHIDSFKDHRLVKIYL